MGVKRAGLCLRLGRVDTFVSAAVVEPGLQDWALLRVLGLSINGFRA